jgi:3-methyladenine DNA glycosylase/8-oxoguanine DNA glycosylase
MQFILPAHRPFNYASVVDSHGWRQLAPFEFDEGSYILSYTDQLRSGKVAEYRFSPAEEGLQVETSHLTRLEQKEAEAKAAWMFGLDMDFSRFYSAARGEPKLKKARRMAHGRVLRSATLFEDVVKTILTTNTLWGATKRMNMNLVQLLGAAHPKDPNKHAFPSPAAIAAAGSEVLRDKVRTGYRSPAIHDLAVRVASGAFNLEALKSSGLPTLELRQELLKIKGVGPYAAANLLLILGRSDFIPVDTWALKLVSHEWYDGSPVTAREVEKAFEAWGEYKGLAFWFWDWKYKG